MIRVLVGMIFHETNTFSPFKTGIPEFKKRSYTEREEMIAAYENTKTPLGAFLETLQKEKDIEIVPSIGAAAEPSGAVTADAIQQMTASLLAPAKEKKVDAVLLALHGAMVTEIDDDGDGWILERVREVVGKDVLVAATLDLHANLSQRMINCANILVPYNQYPHADMYERGLVAANLFVRALRGEIKPIMKWAPLPLLTSLKETKCEDYQVICKAMSELESKPEILMASVLHSFYLTDSKETCASVLVIPDGDEAAAQNGANYLAKVLWENRKAMVYVNTYTAKSAYEDACKEGNYPVVFADVCDNPGVGSTEDATALLKELIELHAQRVAYALIVDPETVDQCHKAGTGATIEVHLGGKMAPEKTGEPITCNAYVKSLSDGRYRNHGPMHGGLAINLRKTAVIVIEGITVIVSAVPTQTYDIEIFRSHGLVLEDYDILVVKSSIHYRAAFSKVAKKLYGIECPGTTILNLHSLDYKKCLRSNYPLNQNAEYN